MLAPSSCTSPSTVASETVSCIRFRQRSSVDFPQPDGPMMAVISRSRTSIVMLRRTRDRPKYALSRSVERRGALARESIDSTTPGSTDGSMTDAISVSADAKTGSRSESREQADDEHDEDQYQSSCPSLTVCSVVWSDGVREYL